ncbi:MAG TPA: electron transfer flavoprotein subunit beta/FixA family protein [Acidobacteriota bacterium]|jgi:electron transfer flavoprotein beta subunit|nr:electron transfer flavoprotein subunit beta/FixA family protein [Acidobacteriota bacterium]|tara:strand:+ start:1590 stop:2339 length:750 start_codon:yes stop_codon:yes gene_type:complete
MKAVVEPESRIELGTDGEVQRANFRYELNEYDLYAVEEGIRMAELYEAEVTVVSAGPEEAVQSLRKGLAMGATDAIFVPVEESMGDAFLSATVLAAALKPIQPDLVLAGVESNDLGGSQVGVLVAEQLGYVAATMTISVQVGNDGVLNVRRELEGGNFVEVNLQMPAVLTIQTGLNEPRYPSLKGIMAAKRKDLVRLELSSLDLSGSPLVETIEYSYPPQRERAQMLEGSSEAIAGELVSLLREKEKVL